MFKIIGIFLFCFVFSFALVFGLRYRQVQQIDSVKFNPENIILKPSPPSSALTGSVVDLLGNVALQKRNTSDISQLMPDDPLLQGETVSTDSDSEVTFVFPSFLRSRLSPQSNISFINTIPTSFLISQNQGQVEYSSLGDSPSSIKTLHLLTQLNSGNVTLQIINQKVNLVLSSGSLTLAYEDKNNITHTDTFSAPKKIVFNDATRSLTFPRR